MVVATGFDLRDEIEAICVKLGVPHDFVHQIVLEPTAAEVVVFKQNENGAAYLENGVVAREIRRFAIARS